MRAPVPWTLSAADPHNGHTDPAQYFRADREAIGLLLSLDNSSDCQGWYLFQVLAVESERRL